MEFILDLGSGNTCQNSKVLIERMIDAITAIDPQRKFILKWQLFEKAGNNIPLTYDSFDFAYGYARERGYKTTASVFDAESLNYLLQFKIPFVKLANRADLQWLSALVPRGQRIVFSFDSNSITCKERFITGYDGFLFCVSEYPATIEQYEQGKDAEYYLKNGISDHTTDWKLFRAYEPEIYECHFKLPDSTGADAGPFARTPAQLQEIYEEII